MSSYLRRQFFLLAGRTILDFAVICRLDLVSVPEYSRANGEKEALVDELQLLVATNPWPYTEFVV